MDIGLHEEIQNSYKLFQARILDEYDRLAMEYDLQVMDAQQPIEAQQKLLRRAICPHLENMPRGVAVG